MLMRQVATANAISESSLTTGVSALTSMRSVFTGASECVLDCRDCNMTMLQYDKQYQRSIVV